MERDVSRSASRYQGAQTLRDVGRLSTYKGRLQYFSAAIPAKTFFFFSENSSGNAHLATTPSHQHPAVSLSSLSRGQSDETRPCFAVDAEWQPSRVSAACQRGKYIEAVACQFHISDLVILALLKDFRCLM